MASLFSFLRENIQSYVNMVPQLDYFYDINFNEYEKFIAKWKPFDGSESMAVLFDNFK
jgi:hypothetical protein